MCTRAPHICGHSRGFLAISDEQQWLGEEDAARRLATVTAHDHRICVDTAVPGAVAFCHNPPWCFTMMTVGEYDLQSWFPGVV